MKTLQEIEKRLSEIMAELRADGITEDQVAALEKESNDLMEEKRKLTEGAQRRDAVLQRIAGGMGNVQRTFEREGAPTPTPTPNSVGEERRAAAQQQNADPHDTPEYRRAFMDFVCRGRAIPAEMRANETMTTTDASAVIPTTTLQEIVKEMQSFGEVYAEVRKLNVQGGVNIPILSLKPTATWIDENTPSEDKKAEANTFISFSYYGLECKIAQTLLASIVTFEIFQREFVALATEAIIKALEVGIFNGDGSNKMTGVTVDTRVPAANKISISAEDFASWDGWKKKVFAKMKKAYRKGKFYMAQATFDGYIDGMVDANGQPIGRVNYGIEGEEKYRFGGKTIVTVEDDCIKAYEDAASGDVIAVFMNPADYGINSNMQMRVVKWEDHDANKVKNKCILICDGKLIDANGVLIIKKA